MRKTFVVSLLLLSFSMHAEEIVKTKDGREVILYDDHTWSESTKTKVDSTSLRAQLRTGVNASEIELSTACEMLSQGWKYTMPEPRSAKAGWGVRDGRTTWWNGYWKNTKTGLYSNSTPVQGQSGLFLGDNQNRSGTWRNGGSPARPDIYMFLLSDSGGPL